MGLAQVFLVGVVALFAIASSALTTPPIKVPVTTKYITTEVLTVDQDETIVMIGHLCEQSQGMAVNVTVLLNNNPSWNPTFGVFRYYVVDSPDKTNASALCTNSAGERPVPNCIVKSWPSTNDIYIKGTAGGVAAISFTLDAEFFTQDSKEAGYIHRHAPRNQVADLKYDYSPPVRRDPVVLTEIITLSTTQELGYRKTALLNFTFCPTPQTGSRYEVDGTVTGTDGQSSYTQYICDKLPCVVDGKNVIAHDGRQLPVNDVTTESGQWKTLYALIVCWGGIYDPVADEYIGHFLFNAQQV